MLVVATAGHVDHGKSTLVRALTGMEPDRWAEEHRRGLTLDLGYAWTTLEAPDGTVHPVAFVDVPGHQRFIGNMLAGLGPAPAVLLVVAADAGWSAQTTEHVAAVEALCMDHAVVAVTRSDLADPAPVVADLQRRLPATGLREAPVIAVSALSGRGLEELRAALADLAATAAGIGSATASGGPDLWLDRAFTVRGSGTVVTGTLAKGTIGRDDPLWLVGLQGPVSSTARRLQSLGSDKERVEATARVAVNLRGIPLVVPRRGDRLLGSPSKPTCQVDVRCTPATPHTGWRPAESLPGTVMLHLGTAAREVRTRRLNGDLVRLDWRGSLVLLPGDRGILRDPGRGVVLAGVEVLDPFPPELVRRGDARRRAAELDGDVTVLRYGDLLVERDRWRDWGERLRSAAARAPVPLGQVSLATGMPHARLATALADSVGLSVSEGAVHGGAAPWEAALVRLQARLERDWLDAPTREELSTAGLTAEILRQASRAGRILLLPGGIALGAGAPRAAHERLATLPARWTTSQARQALGTSRRVVIPLLEHLDSVGVTRRVDTVLRELNAPAT